MDLAGPSWVPSSSSSSAASSNRGHQQADTSESNLSGPIRSLGAIFGRQRRSSSSASSQSAVSQPAPVTPIDLASNQIQGHHDKDNNHYQTQHHHLHENRLAAELSPLRLPTSAGTHHHQPAATSTTNLDINNSHQLGEIRQNQANDSSDSWQHQLSKHVKLDLVRDLIVEHSIELAIILVILIYLVYYFSRISRRPKLIGNKQSDFVASIKLNFKQTLKSRFSPLIYFWGTNPQTALFGYLQGRTSNDEVPRSKFHRQFLYVSDVQYLTSNVDLSEHYEKCSLTAAITNNNNNNNNDKRAHHIHHRLYQLNEHLLDLQQKDQDEQHNKQLRENLQLVINNHHHRLAVDTKSTQQDKVYYSESEEEELARVGSDESGDTQRANGAAKLMGQLVFKRTSSADSSGASAMGSSSDSGVFANCESGSSSASSSSGSNSSSFSSASSNSSLTIDMPTPQMGTTASKSSRSSTSSTISCSSSSKERNCDRHHCDCNSLYENKVDFIQVEGTQKHLQQAQKLKREHFESGQCALDWYLDSHQQYHKNKAVALISAGMTTGSDKKYVTDTVQTLHKLGYEVCVFIRRGVGGLKLNSTKFFSPSKWHDFETAIISIKKQRPNCRLVAIGFSFGSIELCRYLAMSGTSSLVASALLVSCPFDPEAGGRNMRKDALNRKIDAYLAKNLGKQLFHALPYQATSDNNKYQMNDIGEPGSVLDEPSVKTASLKRQQQCIYANYNGSVIDLSSLPKIKSLVDFEDNYNRVIQNYPNSDAYGADSRLNEQLAQIKTPTLCLSSEDDFMAPVKLLPIEQIEANENLCMILTKRGGHMAFIDGLVWPKKPYFAQRIIEKYMQLEVLQRKQADNCNDEMTAVK